MTPTSARTACPTCGQPGRTILPETVEEHVKGGSGFTGTEVIPHFCATGECPVVFFTARGDLLLVDDVEQPVFQKSSDPERLVCYCFGHSVRKVEQDARSHQRSLIAEGIADKCRAGLDGCRVKNPQGACWLGNVRAVAKRAAADIESPTPTPRCCCGGSSDPEC